MLGLREGYLQELNAQSRYHACHERGWTDTYLVSLAGQPVGYGSVKGLKELKDRDTIFEWYVTPAYREHTSRCFKEFVKVSGALYIEGQTNDPLLAPLMAEWAEHVESEVVLFADGEATRLVIPGAVVRLKRESDKIFPHHVEPEGEYVLERQGVIVATGGFFRHYNPPFADLYMEVKPEERRKGYGSFLLQEIQHACRQAGRVPAARCHATNAASHAALRKAGMTVCGRMGLGRLKVAVD